MTTHHKLFEESKKYVPGGVHSPVRGFKGFDHPPIFFQSGDGAYLKDVDGKDYIDFCMSFGPLLLGHRDKDVESTLHQAVENGWSFGACEPYSLELAKFIVDQIPFIEQIRFVNSGTEAVMTALRLARGYTGRNKILKFDGCYHGHTDSMLIKAGSGLAGTTEASSKGVSEQTASETLICELGNLKAVNEIFEREGSDIAALIIEPLPANNGLLLQDLEYLKGLREITKKYETLLIFDEVISGFRVGLGGMSEYTRITPDIVTYGKIIGGGMPVGAIASKKEIMEKLAPIGDVYQAGTLSANPLAMACGLETLKKLTKENYTLVESYANKIALTFRKWLEEYNNGEFNDYQVISFSSLFWVVPTNQPVRALEHFPKNLGERFEKLFFTLLEKGIYLSPNAYEVGFVSLAHNEEVIKDLEDRLWK